MTKITQEQMRIFQELADREILGAAQVAVLLGYSRRQIYRLAASGRIPVHKPNGGRLVFLKSEIMEYLTGC